MGNMLFTMRASCGSQCTNSANESRRWWCERSDTDVLFIYEAASLRVPHPGAPEDDGGSRDKTLGDSQTHSFSLSSGVIGMFV